jgi:SNF2 family DNA or RNA helicase
MLCTWQKMGIGHTLTAANYVIFVDTPWTDADFQQCADRIYRIGQNKKCFIITLITKGTYDERVQEILEKKECLSGYLIDNKETDKLNIFNE